MAYMKIKNLYRPEASKELLGRKEVYACEKIHGTSAHIKYHRDNGISFFSGGIKHVSFLQMLDERFNLETIATNFRNSFTTYRAIRELTVYGEAYGGKCQRMSNTYGPLNFIAFEVKIDEDWLNVQGADNWARLLGFEFVHYEKGPATVEWLDSQRDKPSVQARRNGMGDDKHGEGIVVRPLREETDHRGNRILAKHKRTMYGETKTPRSIDPNKQRIWREARVTAEEWVTPVRLEHVIDALKAQGCEELGMRETGTVIRAMINDVKVESGAESLINPEIEWSNEISKAIGAEAARLYKKWVTTIEDKI